MKKKSLFGEGPRVRCVGMFNIKDINDESGSIILNWAGSSGFGQLTIVFDKDGEIYIDTECTGPKLVREVFDHIIANAKYDTDDK